MLEKHFSIAIEKTKTALKIAILVQKHMVSRKQMSNVNA